jgi:hypothetical protein
MSYGTSLPDQFRRAGSRASGTNAARYTANMESRINGPFPELYKARKAQLRRDEIAATESNTRLGSWRRS